MGPMIEGTWATRRRGDNRGRCVAPGCSNVRGSRGDLVFFQFPKNEERCKEWIKRMELPELLGRRALDVHKTCCLCSAHFSQSQMTYDRKGRRTLTPDATPTCLDPAPDPAAVPSTDPAQIAAQPQEHQEQGPPEVLVLEPYYGGSHRQLIDLLAHKFPGRLLLHTLPAKKWHWRARVSALHFAQAVPTDHRCRTLLASSVLNLCELCALRPDLSALHKVLYFHENQLEYPVASPKHRDFQYGYNQILSCLVADQVFFNSAYNMESFLSSMATFLKQMPDFRPSGLEPSIRAKSRVLHFPLDLPPWAGGAPAVREGPLHLVWPHRWEHDKNPEDFFWLLFQLQESGIPFRVSVLGQAFPQSPAIFSEARERLSEQILCWGYRGSHQEYLETLRSADVVVSTSKHEFFGVAMLEAVSCGCFPLCPNRLVYPEIFPAEYLYNTRGQLLKTLKQFCKHPHLVRNHKLKLDVTSAFGWQALREAYRDALRITPQL